MEPPFDALANSDAFELLVYDLLAAEGFRDLIWRGPSADGGRDIEASWSATDPIGGILRTRWYVECKWYTDSVLDDEPWQLAWVTDIARAFGGDVAFAATYEEAVKEFDKARPDIAIVDIRIGDVSEPLQGATLKGADPNWTGLRFLRFIRVERNANNVMIFAYTGLDRDELQKIVEDAYGGQFYTKFESSYFRDALTKALKKYATPKKP